MKTVVIIDDEFGLADVRTAALSDIGYRVFSAANGNQGLEVMAEHPPDLMLLDYMMPLLDDVGVLKARCHGYVAFLRKPFEFGALLNAVEQATAGP